MMNTKDAVNLSMKFRVAFIPTRVYNMDINNEGGQIIDKEVLAYHNPYSHTNWIFGI